MKSKGPSLVCSSTQQITLLVHFTELNPCLSNPCQNNATCINNYTNYTCNCGYSCPCAKVQAGYNCELS